MISVRPIILKSTAPICLPVILVCMHWELELFCALRRKLRRYARPWLLLLRQIKAAQRYNEHKQLKYKTSIHIENLETPNWSNITKHRPKTLWTRLANEHHTASLSPVWNIDSTSTLYTEPTAMIDRFSYRSARLSAVASLLAAEWQLIAARTLTWRTLRQLRAPALQSVTSQVLSDAKCGPTDGHRSPKYSTIGQFLLLKIKYFIQPVCNFYGFLTVNLFILGLHSL